MRNFIAAISFCIFALANQAQAKDWVYRIKVIDPASIATLKGAISARTLDSLTKTLDLTVTTPGDTLPTPALSNAEFRVCKESCDKPGQSASPSRVTDNVVEFIYPVGSSEFRQANVFYHLNYVYKKFVDIGFSQPAKAPLVVRVDRHVKHLMFKAEMSNNAFFDENEGTLNFVPSASMSAFFGLFSIPGIDTAYDPTVINHEFTHFILHRELGVIQNSDFQGIHEGLADFFALSFYDANGMGRIFGRGQSIRNLARTRYQIGMESHDKGELLLGSLRTWSAYLSKALKMNHAPKILFGSLGCLSKNLFGSFSYFSQCVLDATRKEKGVDDMAIAEIETLFERRGIYPSRFRKVPARPVTPIVSTGSIEYQTERTGVQGEKDQWSRLKIEGSKIIDGFAWFIVESKTKTSGKSLGQTIVLIDLKTAQVLRSWSPEGIEITPADQTRFPEAISNATGLQRTVESEFSFFKQLSAHKDTRVTDIKTFDFELNGKKIPCEEIAFKPVLNQMLEQMGLNIKFDRIKIASAVDQDDLIAPFTLVNLDAAMSIPNPDKTKPDELMVIKQTLVDFTKLEKPFTWDISGGFSEQAVRELW